MLQIEGITVGTLQTNCYIAWNDANGNGFMVDPGENPEKLLKEISTRGVHLTHILITHGHFDHILALAEIKKATGAKICIHRADSERLISMEGSLYHHFMGNRPFQSIPADVLLEDRDMVQAGDEEWRVIYTPGHSGGSVCYDNGTVIFTGDTLFAFSCGRTDFDGGDPMAMRHSLEKLGHIDGDRICYPGHDRAFRLSDARRCNPMLWGTTP